MARSSAGARASAPACAVALVLTCAWLTACGGGAATTAPTVELPQPRARTYAILFSRPSRAGERARLVVDQTEAKDTKATALDGTVIDSKHEAHVLHYDAVHTVVAIDDQGRPTRARAEVKALVADGRPLAHGVVEITYAPKEKDAVIVVDGEPASQEVRAALSSLLKLHLDGAKDDDVFGTRTPQTIGAHWPIDARLAQAGLRDDSGVDAQTVAGEAWLAGTVRVSEEDCLDVRARLGIDGIKLPGMPEGSVTESSHADAELSVALPLDSRLQPAAEHLSMTMAFKVRVQAPNGPPVTVVVKVDQVQDGHVWPM